MDGVTAKGKGANERIALALLARTTHIWYVDLESVVMDVIYLPALSSVSAPVLQTRPPS
jgi:hypothetical protein